MGGGGGGSAIGGQWGTGGFGVKSVRELLLGCSGLWGDIGVQWVMG